jgi:hypothetical protein
MRLRICVTLVTSITPPARPMKTHRIEVQRIRSMSNANGMLHAQVDASVLPGTNPEGSTPTSWLSLSEADARTLQQLLKAQFAQIDGRKARSQR